MRINTQQNLVLPKPNFKISFKPQLRQVVIFTFFIVLSLIVTSCQVISQIPNPINFTGSEFLTFYITIGVMGIVLASWLRFSLRLPIDTTSQHPDLNTYEIASLAGGNNRTIMTAIASLVEQGYVEVVKEKLPFFTFRTTPQSKLVLRGEIDNITEPVEKAVAQDILATDGDNKQVFQKSMKMKDSIRSRLQQLGLFLSDTQALKAQIYPSLIVFIILGLGLCKIYVGISRDKPVGFLSICMWALLAYGFRFFVKPYRSRYGDRIFNDLTNRSQDLINSSDSKLALAVALFGATVLTADSALADLHQMLASTTGVGGGDGGGGCGGGGCGGCGGCGG